MDAAAALESFSVLREHPGRLAPSPRASAVASPLAGLRPSRLLTPQFTGLRATPRALRTPSAGTRTARRRAAGAVVCEAQDTAVMLPEVDTANWQSLVLESATPVLVDFWAPWCGPCRMIEPTIVKLAKAYEGKLKCYKLNTDQSPDIATRYGIRSIPTMMIFKNGEKKDAIIGAVKESTLVESIEKFVDG